MIKPGGLAGIAEDEQIQLRRVFFFLSHGSEASSKLSHDDHGKSLRPPPVKFCFHPPFFSCTWSRKSLPGRTLPAEDTVFKFNLASHGQEEFTTGLSKREEKRNRLQTKLCRSSHFRVSGVQRNKIVIKKHPCLQTAKDFLVHAGARGSALQP